MLFVLKHTLFGMSLLFTELIRTQQEVTLLIFFGPAFSSHAIWSVIRHPRPAFSVAPVASVVVVVVVVVVDGRLVG